MVIQSNMPALNANRLNKKNNRGLAKSLEKLSSGYEINRAGDNAAGLAVSEKMRSQIIGMKQSVRNCADGVSLVQTFEGALGEIHTIIKRCKSLADQSANGTYDNNIDRAAIQQEYIQLCDEVDQISDTDFNGFYMLNGNPTVTYTPHVEQIPYLHETTETLYDQNGNLVRNVEDYKLTAQFERGSPFKNGMFAPCYTLESGRNVKTEYGNGSTSMYKLNLTFTDSGGQQITRSYIVNNSNPSNRGTPTSNADGSLWTCTRQITIQDDDGNDIKLDFIQTAQKNETFLKNSDGTDALDDNGDPVVIGRLWTQDIQLKMSDDNGSDFVLTSADMRYCSDTVLDTDSNERYYTSDTSDGPISRACMYSAPDMIDSFSIYYFDLANEEFNGISNKIFLPTGDDAPTEMRLGAYSSSFVLGDSPTPGGGNLNPEGAGHIDLEYSLAWYNKAANGGSINFNIGNRGFTNSFSDTNVTPKVEKRFYDKVTYEANVTYNDVDLVLQVGARTKDAVNFTFEYESDAIGDLKCDLNCTAESLGLGALSLLTQENANIAIDKLDHAMNKVSLIRGTLGATQNRLEHKIDNLNNSTENLTSAESKIRDADMAKEMMEYTKKQILSQTSQSMLAQANSLPQSILNLIGS